MAAERRLNIVVSVLNQTRAPLKSVEVGIRRTLRRATLAVAAFAARVKAILLGVRRAFIATFSVIAGGLGGGAALLGGAGLILIPALVVKEAAVFERSMSRVQAVAQTTREQVGLLSDEAKRLGVTTRFSATEAAQGLEILALAGLDTAQSINVLKPVLDLASIGQIEVAESADIVVTAMKVLGIETGRTSEVVDVLAAAATSGNTTLAELGEAVAHSGRLAKDMNVDVATLAAGLVSFAEGGKRGEEGGVAMRNVLLRLSGANTTANQALEEIGVSLTDQVGQYRDLADIIEDIRVRTTGLTVTDRAATLERIAGTRSVSVFTKMLDEGGDALRANADAIRDSNGAASKMANTIEDNLIGSLIRLKSAIQGAMIEAGESNTGPIRRFVDWLTREVRLIPNSIEAIGLTLERELNKAEIKLNNFARFFVDNPVGRLLLEREVEDLKLDTEFLENTNRLIDLKLQELTRQDGSLRDDGGVLPDSPGEGDNNNAPGRIPGGRRSLPGITEGRLITGAAAAGRDRVLELWRARRREAAEQAEEQKSEQEKTNRILGDMLREIVQNPGNNLGTLLQ